MLLREFLGGETKAVLSTFRGKFGLGLSGGGFRASLYHIGVLARLAEIGVLKHVEVLSCVSGGSIVGAYYYLEVRKLLQTKTDAEISDEDYVEIVQRMEEHFLAGVQRNIRTRVLAELSTNLKMIFSPGYSRTERVGELYERELYAKIHDRADGSPVVTGPLWLLDPIARLFGWRRDKRLLQDLRVYPKLKEDDSGQPVLKQDFKPRRDNWRREHKVPVLVLNACSLNTGHTWQFTTSYMGEPPQPIQAAIDANYRLRRFYYENKPHKSRPVTLGQAVAASSCVPGLFEPVILDGLYPHDDSREISVRLVDGGVCDNQGAGSLLEQDCRVMLISDGSGQMDAQDVPSKGVLGVPLRSNSILQARLRETQYVDAAARRRGGLLRGFMFVHLKQELTSRALAWRDCPPDMEYSDIYDANFDARARSSEMTSYDVPRQTEAKLAGVRTDLDSFSQAEAYALMYSGYRMAANQFRGKNMAVDGFIDEPSGEWRFCSIEPALQSGEPNRRLDRLLTVAASSAFKIWRLSLPLIVLKWSLLAAAVSGVAWLFVARWNEPLIPESVLSWLRDQLTFQSVAAWAFSMLVATAVGALVSALIGKSRGNALLKGVHWRDTLRDVAVGVGMSLAGWFVARLHLHVFDRMYLRYGKIDRFSR